MDGKSKGLPRLIQYIMASDYSCLEKVRCKICDCDMRLEMAVVR